MKILITILVWLLSLAVSKWLGLSILFKILLWAGGLYLGAIAVGLIACVSAAVILLIFKNLKG